jgi:BON domain
VTNATFASPIYGGNTTGGGQGGYGLGGFQGNFPSQANLPSGNTATGPNTLSRRSPYYTASPGFDYRPAGSSQVQSAVEQVLARSTSLSPSRNIRVAVEGPAVVLRGTVASEHDRRLAEALVRLTPGVFDVRNELEVPGTVSQAGRGP